MLIQTYVILAGLEMSLEYFEASESYALQALSAQEATAPPGDPDIGLTLKVLVMATLQQEKLKDAERYAQRAVQNAEMRKLLQSLRKRGHAMIRLARK